MYDITSLGELLIDFTQKGISENGQKLYERNPGGAPANVLVAMSRMGAKAAFIGKVGDDIHGSFLKETLMQEGIDISGIVVDKDVFTTLAFVTLDDRGGRNFCFARKPGADIMLTEEEVSDKLILQSKILHIGSLSLTGEPCKSATFHALQVAKAAGCIISYDPNYRAALWDGKDNAVETIKAVAAYADIVKISEEEVDLITPYKDPAKAAEYLVREGIDIAVVTLGENGAYVSCNRGSCHVPGFRSKAVIDTTGAGDAFCGGFLYCISKYVNKINEINLDDIKSFAEYANAAASLCVEKYGGIPGMPAASDIEKRLQCKHRYH